MLTRWVKLFEKISLATKQDSAYFSMPPPESEKYVPTIKLTGKCGNDCELRSYRYCQKLWEMFCWCEKIGGKGRVIISWPPGQECPLSAGRQVNVTLRPWFSNWNSAINLRPVSFRSLSWLLSSPEIPVDFLVNFSDHFPPVTFS